MRRELNAIIAGPKIATRAEISVMLGRLSLHYWRPNFTEEKNALIVDDYCRDLHGVTVQELADAIEQYRKKIGERYFPTIAQLNKLIGDAVADRERMKRGATRMLEALDAPDTAEADKPQQHDYSKLHEILKPREQTAAQPVADFVPLSAELRERIKGGAR